MLPASCIECSDLEVRLLAAASEFKWNPTAPCFVPFSGSARSLDGAQTSAPLCLVPPKSHIELDYNACIVNLQDKDIILTPAAGDQSIRCVDASTQVAPLPGDAISLGLIGLAKASLASLAACRSSVKALLSNCPVIVPFEPSAVITRAPPMVNNVIDDKPVVRCRESISRFRRQCLQLILWDRDILRLVKWDGLSNQVCSYCPALREWLPHPLPFEVLRNLPIASECQLWANGAVNRLSSDPTVVRQARHERTDISAPLSVGEVVLLASAMVQRLRRANAGCPCSYANGIGDRQAIVTVVWVGARRATVLPIISDSPIVCNTDDFHRISALSQAALVQLR